MATTHLGWENRLAFFWENPLGTVEAIGKTWISDAADTMSLGAEATRRKVYGNRYMVNTHLQVLKSSPAGSPGAIAMWFEKLGKQTFLNRILNSHFQNTYDACPLPPLPCFVAHFPVDEQPSELTGFSIARDIGLGWANSFLWENCVANQLEISWGVGKPILCNPTFISLNGQPDEAAPGLVASDTAYQPMLYQAPNIVCTWGGTHVSVASFKITSNNGIMVKHDPSSITPVGMSLGNFTASLEFQTWVDDDFQTRFVPNYLGTGISPELTGVFEAVVRGPTIEIGGVMKVFYATLHFHGKIVDVPNAQPKADGLQTVKVEMTSPGTGDTYEDAGYYIKLDSAYENWQAIIT